MIPVNEITDIFTPYTLVTPEGALSKEVVNPEWDHNKSYDENRKAGREYFIENPVFKQKWAAFVKCKGGRVGYLVTVDYHN